MRTMTSAWNNRLPPKKPNLTSEWDMISTLPDDVLIHILSLLSTKMAFTTSLLSSRWKYLWASVPSVYLFPSDKPFWFLGYQDPKYMDFIDNVLLSRNSSINKFHLNFASQFDISCITAWISAVVKHNVRHIEIFGCADFDDVHIQLPRNLYTCRTLVTLKIKSYFRLEIPTSICFPCLKVLDLSIVSPSIDLTKKLFCSSPVLEELSIKVREDSGNSVYKIISPVLKKLRMCIHTDDIKNSDSKVIVVAPVLECLKILDYCFLHYIFKDSSSLTAAHINVDVDSCHQLHQPSLEKMPYICRLISLLRSVSGVKDLSIDRNLVGVFGIASERKWAVFSNVTRLQLDVDCVFNYHLFSKWSSFQSVTHLKLRVNDDFASKYLSKLLAQMPNLVSLFLNKVSFHDTSEQFNSFEQVVPSCFRSYLIEIEVGELDGTMSELKVIEYLLANANVLEKMTLTGLLQLQVLLKAEEFESKILKMPRCSKYSKLLMSWRKDSWSNIMLSNEVVNKESDA